MCPIRADCPWPQLQQRKSGIRTYSILYYQTFCHLWPPHATSLANSSSRSPTHRNFSTRSSSVPSSWWRIHRTFSPLIGLVRLMPQIASEGIATLAVDDSKGVKKSASGVRVIRPDAIAYCAGKAVISHYSKAATRRRRANSLYVCTRDSDEPRIATLADNGFKANQFPGRFHCGIVGN